MKKLTLIFVFIGCAVALCPESYARQDSLAAEFLSEEESFDQESLDFILQTAMYEDDIESVRKVLELGANPNESDGMFLPLLSAAVEDNHEVFELLLESGARLDIRNDNDETLFDTLISYTEFAKTAILKGSGPIDLRTHSMMGPSAYRILEWDDVEVTRRFFERIVNFDPNLPSPYSKPLLHTVIAANKAEIVQIVVDHSVGIDVSALDILQKDALSYAVERGDPEIMKLLLTEISGWDLNRGDLFGKTLLHNAVESGNAAMVRTILENGDNLYPAHRDRQGKTPMDYANSEIKSIIGPYLN